MKRIKEWLHNFWWWFRQDPFGYIFEFVLYVLVIALIVFLAFAYIWVLISYIKEKIKDHVQN